MSFRKMIFATEVVGVVSVIIIVLLTSLEPLVGIISLIVVQMIIGNVVLPLYYSKHSDKYYVILETYSSKYNSESEVSSFLKDNSKKILSKVFTSIALLIFLSYGLLILMAVVLWIMNNSYVFDNSLLLIVCGLGPLYVFIMYKFMSFPVYPDENGLNGYFRTSLKFNEKLMKRRVDYKSIENVTLIENKLLDIKKHVVFIEFELKDNTKIYLQLLPYKVKDRKRIIDLMKVILSG